jgi:hypothetical protein
MAGEAEAMLDALLSSALEGVDVLPEAQLKQLVASGRLVSVTTFADHMRPDVHWIEPAEYGMAFDELVKQEGNDMAGKEAAFTEATEKAYPGYINATLGLDEMVITMRGHAIPWPPGQDTTFSEGKQAQLRMSLADWDAFLVQAQRVRAGTSE